MEQGVLGYDEDALTAMENLENLSLVCAEKEKNNIKKQVSKVTDSTTDLQANTQTSVASFLHIFVLPASFCLRCAAIKVFYKYTDLTWKASTA